jgi:hypothetical protein
MIYVCAYVDVDVYVFKQDKSANAGPDQTAHITYHTSHITHHIYYYYYYYYYYYLPKRNIEVNNTFPSLFGH